MQISSTPTAYGGDQAQRLLAMLLPPQGPSSGQDLPGADSVRPGQPPSPPPASQPAGRTSAAQFASSTLASLLSAQEAPPTSAEVAGKIISAADADGDGALSLSEIEKAIGADTTSGTDPLSQAFASLDTNGDSKVSASELSTALDVQKGAGGAHRHHQAHRAPPTSSDLAAKAIGAADTNGDGSLSVDEIETALGSTLAASAKDALTSAIGKLDTNGDGKLSPAELSAGIDAFRAARHRGETDTAAQAVTA